MVSPVILKFHCNSVRAFDNLHVERFELLCRKIFADNA